MSSTTWASSTFCLPIWTDDLEPMIKFTLACENAHQFESWFQNGAAFDFQVEAGLVGCPICGARKVAKAIMAPAITGRRRGEPEPPAPRQVSEGQAAEAPTKVALLDPKDRELRAMIESLRTRIFAEAQDVGEHFPEEARKIHDGLVEERPIHGQASVEEARALLEEGIGILPIPLLPDEHN
jgi:hypothetical protein